MPRPVEEQLAYLKKGVAEIIPETELTAKLEKSVKTGRPLRVYLGVDPTAPDIHLGHTVVLRKLKHFQNLGHTAIFLIGDFSAMIGDPTGVSETRPPLTREQVDANAKTYLDQVFKILDRDKTEVRYNSEWLGKMSAEAVVRLCGRYRLARMLEREDFRSRLENNQPISVHELLYPLLTACDAVELESDVEIGATEQKFNLLVHRDIQIAVHRERAVQRQLESPGIDVEYERHAQVCLTMPILVGLDGQRKMSKSLNNYIGITESPQEMFGKIMSIPDELMWSYYELLTDLSPDEVLALKKRVESGELHPRDAKVKLATQIVDDFHSPEADHADLKTNLSISIGTNTAAEFNRIYRDRQAPSDIPENYIGSEPGKMRLSRVLVRLGATESRAEAERLIKQGAVEIDNVVAAEPTYEFDLNVPRRYLLKVGKKKFFHFIIQ